METESKKRQGLCSQEVAEWRYHFLPLYCHAWPWPFINSQPLNSWAHNWECVLFTLEYRETLGNCKYFRNRRQFTKFQFTVWLFKNYFYFLVLFITTVSFFPLYPPPPISTPTSTVNSFTVFISTSHSYLFFVRSPPFPFFPPLSSSPLHSNHFQLVPCFHACGSSWFIS